MYLIAENVPKMPNAPASAGAFDIAGRTQKALNLAKAGDVCFLYCSDEALIYSPFIVRGRDADGKLRGYSRDRLNDENSAFRVENICPSLLCGGEISQGFIFHFND